MLLNAPYTGYTLGDNARGSSTTCPLREHAAQRRRCEAHLSRQAGGGFRWRRVFRALLGPADKRAGRPTRTTCSRPTRKSPTGQETNSSAAFLSLCDPTFITGEGGDRASAENLIQIIRPRHRVHHKAVSYQAWGAGQVPSYRVSFINDIPRNAKLFHCCQRSIVVRTARSPERAVEAAKKRFARPEGICNWNIHADRIELEVIDLPQNRTMHARER